MDSVENFNKNNNNNINNNDNNNNNNNNIEQDTIVIENNDEKVLIKDNENVPRTEEKNFLNKYLMYILIFILIFVIIAIIMNYFRFKFICDDNNTLKIGTLFLYTFMISLLIFIGIIAADYFYLKKSFT